MPKHARTVPTAHEATFARGIREDSHSIQAFIRANGVFRSKRFPKGTPLREMQLWREETRLRLLGRIAPEPTEHAVGNFYDDVRVYLSAIVDMPTLRWRRDDMAHWMRVFGTRPRHTITPLEIRQQLAQWRKVYAASTVNHRRTALLHFFTVLDGKSGPNPVREVPRYRDDSQDAPPRALPLPVVIALLKGMPESKTKARLELMAWTGWPHAQIARLQSVDIDWKAQRVYVRARQKGRGVAGRWTPVLPQAWAALRKFRKWDAWGKFSPSSARKSLRLSAEHLRTAKHTPRALKVAVQNVTPYQLRHSFLTLIAATTHDDRAVATLGLHSDRRQADRYTKAATDPRVANALAAVARVAKLAQKAS